MLRALEERGMLGLADGRIATGWLIVEDLFTVAALVILPAVAAMPGGGGGMSAARLALPLAVTLAKVAGFVALMLVVGARVLPWLLEQVVRTGSRELFTLAVVAVALGIAFAASELFGVSFALGAFCAGVVVSESDHSHRAAEQAKPLEDAFAVLFFLSVGMLFDPGILVRHPFQVLAVLAVILLGKSIAAFAIVRLAGYPAATALTVAASLAQIGEFSFMLAALGAALGLLSADGQNLILAGALISITLNPAAFGLAAALRRRLDRGQPA
jgi:CPA2 family monovalent cation:H+ antiporter-2